MTDITCFPEQPHKTSYKVTGKVNNQSDLEGQGIFRSVLPESSTVEYDYYLYGKTETRILSLEPIELTVSGSTKVFRKSVQPGVWEFTLYALEQGADEPENEKKAQEAALLMARACCDLTNADADAIFTLSENSIRGNGDVDVDVYLSNDNGVSSWYENLPANCSIYISIRDLITDKNKKTEKLNFADAINNGLDYVNFKADSLAMGTYNLVVFVQNEQAERILVWTDTVTVQKNKTSKGNVYVPNLIGVKPDEVASLSATYIKNSEDDEDHFGYYKVYFKWDAAHIKNEQYFELQVADITDVDSAFGTIADYTWEEMAGLSVIAYTPTGILPKVNLPGNVTLAGAKGKPFTSDYGDYVGGSLGVNSSNVCLWLELGHKYTARIRAVNNAACSGWTKVTLPDGTSGNTVTAPGFGNVAYFVDDNSSLSDSINRYRLRYYFNGGEIENHPYLRKFTDFRINSSGEQDTYEAGVLEYHTADSGCAVGIPLWNGASPSSSMHSLAHKKADDTWAELRYWVKPEYFATGGNGSWNILWRCEAEATTVPNVNLKTFRNVNLYAVYDD